MTLARCGLHVAAACVCLALAGCVADQGKSGKAFGYRQTVSSGMLARAGDYATIGWDGAHCRVRLPEVAIVRAPQHGTMTIARGTGVSNTPASGPLAACAGKTLPAIVVSYQSRAGYRGADLGVYRVTYPDGQTDIYEKHFTVR
ncbi:MAG: hypothetical protein ACRCXM_01980 [Beijerinckiaceae bacterium]